MRGRRALRTLTAIDAIRGAEVRINGRWLTGWCTNDYLGLSLHPHVIRAASEAAASWGVGARASRLLAGTTAIHAKLEAALASFFRAESALVFASGYLANLGILTTLLGPGDAVFLDRLCHASLIDACRASKATLRVFAHNDADQLASLLRRSRGHRRCLVVTEGVFSMDGDRAPLRKLAAAANASGATLYVDDAHGAFVLGKTGRGSPEAAGVPHGGMVYMGTLGKALGAQGGFVVGPKTLIDAVLNTARPFIYATALAVPVAAAALEALILVEADPAPRERLHQLAARLHAGLAPAKRLREPRSAERSDRSAFRVPDAPSHIVPVILGSSERAVALSDALKRRGIWAPAIRPPTVPAGTARLRLSVTALHTDQHIAHLVNALRASHV